MTTLQRSNLCDGIAGTRLGSGTELLLIHGVGMNADYWGNLIPSLAAHFALTLIDMPGHGNSAPLTNPTPELHYYTDAIAGAVTTPAIVAGHSMGALIALDLAVRYPQLTTGIAVLNGIYRRSNSATQAILQRVNELHTQQSIDPTATLARWFGQSPTGINATAQQQCNQWLRHINPQYYAAAYRAFAMADAPADEALAAIRCPALFMTGELEPNSTPAMSTAMCTLVPQSHCIIVPDAKHMMSMTHGEVVQQAIISFFGATDNA